MSMPFHVVVPARYGSERLPGKPLAELGGAPMVVQTARRAAAAGAASVTIATDDDRVLAAATAVGFDALITDPDHASGTDRIAECARRRGWKDDEIVVNLQGDEPLMPAACLLQVAQLLAASGGAAAASLYRPIDDAAEVNDPNAVKVVVDDRGSALYFSRSPIPFVRDQSVAEALAAGSPWRRHVGLYAYRVETLAWFTDTAPTPLEQVERLEQLRLLEHSRAIVLAEACQPIPAGVDTSEDLERMRSLIVGR